VEEKPPETQKGSYGKRLVGEEYPCGAFFGALGRTRTCDLLIRSHSPSETQVDTEGLDILRGGLKRDYSFSPFWIDPDGQ
jgi:hypothetical protein